MAKIFKTNDQEKALKDIINSLKIIDSINKVMKDEDVSDFKVRLMGSTNSGTMNETIPMPFTIISSQIKDYRKKLIKEVQDKSKTYSISLEDEELEILGVKVKKEPVVKEKEEEVVEQKEETKEETQDDNDIEIPIKTEEPKPVEEKPTNSYNNMSFFNRRY